MTQNEERPPASGDEPCFIRLSNNAYAIVDAKHFEWLSTFVWHQSTGGYAVRWTTVEGKRKAVWMHREICKPDEGLQTDHINHVRLDNRERNLRAVERWVNNVNCRSRKVSATGYRGVYLAGKNKDRFRAALQVFRTYRFLGTFDDPDEAALAYNNAATAVLGEYAQLNRIPDDRLRHEARRKRSRAA